MGCLRVCALEHCATEKLLLVDMRQHTHEPPILTLICTSHFARPFSLAKDSVTPLADDSQILTGASQTQDA